MQNVQPLVSIGVPIYNAEEYLREALDSLCGQDYQNLEIIISDNASTDSTDSICREYAAKDPRIAYSRNAENMGAAFNQMRVLELARGKYFMWSAHDDYRDHSYVGECVSVMEADESVVCVYTDTVFVDEKGQKIEPQYIQGHPRMGRPGLTRRQRVDALTAWPGWYGFYGLMRADVLRKTGTTKNSLGLDAILLLKLCLAGQVIKIDKPLFFYRTFQAKSLESVMEAVNVSNKGKQMNLHLDILKLLLETIDEADLPKQEKLEYKSIIVFNFTVRNRLMRSRMGAEANLNVRRSLRERRLLRAAKFLPFSMLSVPDKIHLARLRYEAGLVRSYKDRDVKGFIRYGPAYLLLNPGSVFRPEAWTSAMRLFGRSKPTLD